MSEIDQPHRAIASESPFSIGARLDRIPVMTRTHRVWVAALTCFYVFEILDVGLVTYTSTAWRSHLGMSVGQIGLTVSSTFAGMIIGGIVGGRLADRFGRKPVLLGGCLVMSVGCLATSLLSNVDHIVISRFFTGLGVQATAAVVLVTATELLPAAFRGRYTTIIVGIGFFASPLTALFAAVVVPLSADGWRWMFSLGGLGILVVVTLGRRIPESPRWLEAHGRSSEADRIVNALEGEVLASNHELPSPVQTLRDAPNDRALPMRDLFRRFTFRPLAVACVGAAGAIMIQYGFNTWVPVLLVDRGVTESHALWYTTALSFAGALGALSTFFYVDRWQRKNLISVLAVTSGVAALLFGFGNANVIVLPAGLLAAAGTATMMAVIYSYVPELFSTGLRGVGTGLSYSVGRLAGVGGSLAVPAIYAGHGFSAVYVYVAVLSAVVATVIGTLGIPTAREKLM